MYMCELIHQVLSGLELCTAGALARLLPDGEAAAAAAVRVLIEVLRVAHPADLDHRRAPGE